MRHVLAAMLIVLAGGALGDGARAGAADDDAWPGFVPGGQFYRNIEWGVSFYGPGQADQQFLTTRNLLVRYSVAAGAGEPGWVISVVTAKLEKDLPAGELLTASARQLQAGLGGRAADVKVATADAGQAPVIGRVSCRIDPARGQSGSAEYRTYVYIRLRPQQYVALVGSTTAKGVADVNRILDEMAGSVHVFDPQAENAELTAAAGRTTRLIGGADVDRFSQLAGAAGGQWMQAWRTEQPGGQAVASGWGYLAIVRRGRGEIEAVTSYRVDRGGEKMQSYQSAYVNMGTGDEIVREQVRVIGAEGGKVEEVTLTARRRGDKIEVVELATGKDKREYEVKIAGNPYLPTALQSLMLPLAAGQDNTLFGAFGYAPARSQVLFQTLRNAGRVKLEMGGRQIDARRWLSRPSTSFPRVVRWTDPSGVKVLREQFSPLEWSDAVDENKVPADIRRDLTTPPQW